ncbi:hypothetical protein [Rugosimonospora africana]|uniref:Uncharacterized protein n=1 Tax=Rugosimonospora africana TaxID=556532 RepID=A0A8J3QZI6_9ACTN|nr:hypothetical protein [Rugosimonospora africana]GIH18620.1 hypothetical protein Raf01_67920 [Rugosimonospora africana]
MIQPATPPTGGAQADRAQADRAQAGGGRADGAQTGGAQTADKAAVADKAAADKANAADGTPRPTQHLAPPAEDPPTGLDDERRRGYEPL